MISSTGSPAGFIARSGSSQVSSSPDSSASWIASFEG
jgi:hypothetical protein